MSIAVGDINSANTFGHWIARTNQMADAFSTQVMTTNTAPTGGSGGITGTFSAATFDGATFQSNTGALAVISTTMNMAANSRFNANCLSTFSANTTFNNVNKIKVIGYSGNAQQNFLFANSTGYLQYGGTSASLVGLSDVNTSGLVNGSIIQYQSNTSSWVVGSLNIIPTLTVTNLTLGTILGVWSSSANCSIGNNTITVNAANKRVGLGISTPAVTLDVSGVIHATGDIAGFQTSDQRFKKNVKPLSTSDSLAKILAIEAVEFEWDRQAIGDNQYVSPLATGHDIGVIAQQLREIDPTLVITRLDGTLAVNYMKLIPLILAAIKQLASERNS